jgi:hypothetical protein
MKQRWLSALAAITVVVISGDAAEVERLRATGGLPADIVGLFREPAAFERIPGGDYLVFDRAGHGVYRVGATNNEVTRLVQTGPESGRVLGPSGFVQAGRRFLVADTPGGRERVQLFERDGTRVLGFTLPGMVAPRITFGSLTLSGVSSLEWTGASVIMSRPELGGLMTEFTPGGRARRTLGRFRPTGHEDDPDLHLALNSGLPLVDPTGGYYFVFHAGVPMFRKYDLDGQLLFERHIEGPELDTTLQRLPTEWPDRQDTVGLALPLIPPTVRTAAVDPAGRLWVSLVAPFTYVYDRGGDKVRTLQFEAAGTVTPNSLFFEGADRLLVTPGCYIFDI